MKIVHCRNCYNRPFPVPLTKDIRMRQPILHPARRSLSLRAVR